MTTPGKRKRASFRAAGEAARQAIMDATADPLTTAQELRVLMGIVALTATYSRTEDDISHSQVAKASRVRDPRQLRRVIRSLCR